MVNFIAGVLFRLPGLTCIIMQYRAEDRSNLVVLDRAPTTMRTC